VCTDMRGACTKTTKALDLTVHTIKHHVGHTHNRSPPQCTKVNRTQGFLEVKRQFSLNFSPRAVCAESSKLCSGGTLRDC
jgi:hypothetical protein